MRRYALAALSMLAFTQYSHARDNGDLDLINYLCIDRNTGVPYTASIWYLFYEHPSQSSPHDWEVVTSSGEKVPYMKIYSADFNQSQKDDLESAFQSATSGAGTIISEPSAAYNCYAFALGRTDVWIFAFEDILSTDFTRVYSIGAAEIADHAAHGDTEHASKIAGEAYHGKFGHFGVLQMSKSKIEDIYDCNATRWWVSGD